MSDYILAIDQGTTSSRAIIFDQNYQTKATAQQEFTQFFPHSGWVEHDGEEIWQSVIHVCQQVMEKANLTAKNINAIGITNQRETTIIWDKNTGKPIYNAIVWQDRRTSDICDAIIKAGHEERIADMTGLLCNPYFTATKISWILDHVDGARDKAKQGKLLMGTMDTYLIWKLTGGNTYASDATNASRTMLYDIREQRWRNQLGDIFRVPIAALGDVKDCSADYGETLPEFFGGAIKITGVAGDQQAASVGQACFDEGMMKSTYGTGCFALLNTGKTPYFSKNKLLTTIAYRLDGETTYALEGSIFVAGSAIQWLRDGLKIIDNAAQSGEYAQQANDESDVVFIPAFVGLGAPYWDSECRGAIFGLTRATSEKEICKAALESVAFQTNDLLNAMQADWGASRTAQLRVDGGMVNSDIFMQILSDILQTSIDRPVCYETTALGAAYLAGRYTGFYPDIKEFQQQWQCEQQFTPKTTANIANAKYQQWQEAVASLLHR